MHLRIDCDWSGECGKYLLIDAFGRMESGDKEGLNAM